MNIKTNKLYENRLIDGKELKRVCFNHTKAEKIVFDSCSFINVNMNNVEVVNCAFVNCDFVNCYFNNVHFRKTLFEQCIFDNQTEEQVEYISCGLYTNRYYNGKLTDCKFNNCKMDTLIFNNFAGNGNRLFKNKLNLVMMKYCTLNNSNWVKNRIHECIFPGSDISNLTQSSNEIISTNIDIEDIYANFAGVNEKNKVLVEEVVEI